MLTYAFFFKSSKVEVEGIVEVWVQRRGNRIEWRIVLKTTWSLSMDLSRTISIKGQAPVQTVQRLKARKAGGWWRKGTKLEVLKIELGLGIICWQYISCCCFSWFTGQKFGNCISPPPWPGVLGIHLTFHQWDELSWYLESGWRMFLPLEAMVVLPADELSATSALTFVSACKGSSRGPSAILCRFLTWGDSTSLVSNSKSESYGGAWFPLFQASSGFIST